jgi:DNA-binding YbaB/EbfC family protein
MEVSALQQMLSRFRQLQEDLQRQVNSVTVEASAGGGMVVVKMNGQKQIVDVHIEPDFASKDQEMLQDLVRAAVNEASRRVDDRARQPDEKSHGWHSGHGRDENSWAVLILLFQSFRPFLFSLL